MELTCNILFSQLWILFFLIWGLLTEQSALFILVCVLGQAVRFFRVKEQQTRDWTLGENVTCAIPNNLCNGGFSYNFGGNPHFFEFKRNNYATNSSGFNFGCYGAGSSFFICPAANYGTGIKQWVPFALFLPH